MKVHMIRVLFPGGAAETLTNQVYATRELAAQVLADDAFKADTTIVPTQRWVMTDWIGGVAFETVAVIWESEVVS